MSVDLSRPLVPSQGMHDPLDGLVVTVTLGLATEARELARRCADRRWATDDPLGAGGLLLDALGLARLVAEGRTDLEALLAQVLEDCAVSLAAVAQDDFIGLRAARRLAFRELGLALGLHAVAPLGECADVALLERHVPLAAALENFWREPGNQAASTWTAHADINAVTLAAARQGAETRRREVEIRQACAFGLALRRALAQGLVDGADFGSVVLAARLAARDLLVCELPVLRAHHPDVANLRRGERLQIS